MPNFIKLLIIASLSLLFIACTENIAQEDSSTVKTGNSTQKVKEISIKELTNDFLDEHLIIDIRELHELQAGVITNSVHIPMGAITSELPKYLQSNFNGTDIANLKNMPILLYCRSGRRSYVSAETLQKIGFTNVTSLAGGIKAYKKSNQ